MAGNNFDYSSIANCKVGHTYDIKDRSSLKLMRKLKLCYILDRGHAYSDKFLSKIYGDFKPRIRGIVFVFKKENLGYICIPVHNRFCCKEVL